MLLELVVTKKGVSHYDAIVVFPDVVLEVSRLCSAQCISTSRRSPRRQPPPFLPRVLAGGSARTVGAARVSLEKLQHALPVSFIIGFHNKTLYVYLFYFYNLHFILSDCMAASMSVILFAAR